MGGSICSTIDDLFIDEVNTRPCAYVKYQEKIEYEKLKYLIGGDDNDQQKDFFQMTPEEKRAHIEKMSQAAWANMTEEEKEQKKRKVKEYEESKNQRAKKRTGASQARLRNVSIRARFQPGRFGMNKHRSDDIKRLDESRDDDLGAGDQSMMDVSMMSAGSMVKTVDADSDRVSSNSGSKVQKIGGSETDDINTSMAGLSDYSMDDVKKMDDSAMDMSMAEVDEDDEQKKPTGNILDGLKLDIDRVQNRDNLNDSKINELKTTHRASVVFDENEEYDSEDEERKSFKKQRSPPNKAKFKNLLKPKNMGSEEKAGDATPDSKKLDTIDSAYSSNKKFSLDVNQNEKDNSDVDSSSSDSDSGDDAKKVDGDESDDDNTKDTKVSNFNDVKQEDINAEIADVQ